MAQLFKNNIFGVLQSGISNSATSMTLTDASGFPAPTGGDHYLVTLVGFGGNGSENAWEIIKVAAKASNTLTVVRAQEGTTAVSWPGATQVQMRLTAGSLDTKVDKISGKGLSAEDYSSTEKSKLAGVASGATANATNTELRDRATHTGVQAISTVTGLQAAIDGKEASGSAAAAVSAHIADSDPHPQYTTAVEAAAAAPVQSVAGRSGVVVLTRSDVGLGSVDNTSDANKPVSTATQTALDGKQPLDADLTAIAALAGTSGLLKKTAADTWTLDTAPYTTNTGTVTSVGVSVPTGLSVTGSPVTTGGTIAIALASGYSIPTTTKQANWDSAYGWGNHASAGYYASGGALGTPASGTLSNCTADGTNAVGFRNIPQNSKSAAYTLVLTDAGKCIFHPSADTTARIWTIPANASVAFPIGTAVTFINQHAAGSITISITADTMRLAGSGATGSRTLAANGIATAVKVTATEWIISGTGLT